METIVLLLYVVLFVGSIINLRIMVFSVPLFAFVYPNHLDFLMFGDVNLSMIFVIICGTKLLLDKNFSKGTDRNWEQNLVSFILMLSMSSQILSLVFIENSEYYNCFKSIVEIAFSLIVLVFMSRSLTNPYLVNAFIWGLIISVLLEAIVAIGLLNDFSTFSMYYKGKDMDSIDLYYRATGTFKGPWALGGFLSISIVLIFYIQSCVIQNNITIKILSIVTIIFALYALILTFSRAGWLLLVVSFVYLLIFSNIKTRKTLSYIFIVTFIVFVLEMDWDSISSMVLGRVENTYNNNVTGGMDNSSLDRIQIWDKIVNNYNPLYALTGYGIRHAFHVFGSSAHNSFLSLFVNNGIIGICLFCKFLRKTMMLNRNSATQSRVFLKALLLGMGVYSLTADLIYSNEVATIGLLSLCIFYKLPLHLNIQSVSDYDCVQLRKLNSK